MKTLSRIITVSLALILAFNISVNAQESTEEREMKGFDAIKVSGAFDIKLIQGKEEKVVISGEERYMDNVKTEVVGNTLKVYLRPTVRNLNESYEVVIYFKDLTMIQASGAVDIDAEKKLRFDKLEVYCSGATDINVEMSLNRLEMDLSGASEVDLTGQAKYAKLDVNGASEFDAEAFKIGECHLELSGASEADIHVVGRLEADVSGASDLVYYGDPEEVHIDESGISEVRKGK
jgi:hypothetical protein